MSNLSADTFELKIIPFYGKMHKVIERYKSTKFTTSVQTSKINFFSFSVPQKKKKKKARIDKNLYNMIKNAFEVSMHNRKFDIKRQNLCRIAIYKLEK